MSDFNIQLDNKAVEELSEAVGGGGSGTTVVANPTLVGDEPDLTGLQVDGVKYKVPQGGEGSGVEFVKIDKDATSIDQETLEKLADFNNRTLKPNFIVLTTKGPTHNLPILMPSDNLQCVYRSAVMDDKYYQLSLNMLEMGANVNIEQISVGGGGGVTLYQHNILVEEFVQAQVLTTSATPFTLVSFIQWLGNNQHPCNGMAHSMSEDGIYGNSLYLFVDNNLLATFLYDKPESGNEWNYNFNDNVDLNFTDTVIQIQ